MKTDKKKIGEIGEKLAELIYKKYGHKIIMRNARTRFGEIDLVTKRDGIIHLIEVKVESNVDYGPVIEKWMKTQRRKFIAAVKVFIAQKTLPNPQNLKCELITIDIGRKNKVRFKRFKDLPVNI